MSGRSSPLMNCQSCPREKSRQSLQLTAPRTSTSKAHRGRLYFLASGRG
jgi:hypothetical protein